jgi:hypothetical protein
MKPHLLCQGLQSKEHLGMACFVAEFSGVYPADEI